ncbi:MAG: response regulator [Candidatus Obscuribacterales bacterium]|nr:response regulator [Candidatus Obscuribacterales bacterium]
MTTTRRTGEQDKATTQAQTNHRDSVDAKQLLRGLRMMGKGDFSVRLPLDETGIAGDIAEAFNHIAELQQRLTDEMDRISTVVGKEGKIKQRAALSDASGGWAECIESVNNLVGDLVRPTTEVSRVIGAVAKGDLTQTMALEIEGGPLKGEFLRTAKTINTMVDQLSSFTSEVTRVAREVGTEGKLGGQAQVKGVSGTWKDLTDSVNSMASNLTAQVRNIAEVTTAVAKGDLSKKITVDVKGEILELKNTINVMVDQLSSFASEVTRVAREVGTEGKLGGQADVQGVSGTWKDLTDNVNGLAANLTTQVRAIAEVATAVTKGDLTRAIDVEARGEVAALKDNINEMIRNLKDTTQKNTEQDWLKTNLAKFTSMLQGQRDLLTVANLILSEVAPLVRAQLGVFYINELDEGEPVLKLLGSYAYQRRKQLSEKFRLREGLIGQCALEKQRILIEDVPGDYLKIASGLGESSPRNIVALPVLFEGEVKAIIELASFNYFSETHLNFLDQLTESIGIVLNTIEANMRTENLLKQSQSLAQELQVQQEELTETNRRLEQQAKTLQASEEMLTRQQEELRNTNEELEEKAKLLASQNTEVERKNQEIEQARRSLEEKAEQLALTSKYKSEFLANMSHELRTPLNSLLILSKLLSENGEGNLSDKQVDFSKTIHESGSDLLELINDILDLSKIESGTIAIDVADVAFDEIRMSLERNFRQVAEAKGLEFEIDISPDLPTKLLTDSKRLQQVLKNLLSNAFKFTEVGKVVLAFGVAEQGWSAEREKLNQASMVLSFAVKDTGIGIPLDKQKIIFEAFQQADGSTSRKYGGTGLGLPISREIANLLGGELRVDSAPGEGSTFTLYMPESYSPSQTVLRRGVYREVQAAPPPSVAPQDLLTEKALLLENVVADDRGSLESGDWVLLIIEDDQLFARLLLDMARESGFKGLVAVTGESALALARRFVPDAITLDLRLPDMDGWTILDRLKHDPTTRHIPVNVISCDQQRERGFRQGVIGYLDKPVNKDAINEALEQVKSFVACSAKKLLVIEPDRDQARSVLELIGDGDVKSKMAMTGKEALDLLKNEHFDCLVVATTLSDMSGYEFVRRIRDDLGIVRLPVIVYAGRDFTEEEQLEVQRMGKMTLVKEAESPHRLLDETALFLHRLQQDMPEPARVMIERSQKLDRVLKDRKILIVDDDVRNIFALTSILEANHMKVSYAERGKEAIKILAHDPAIEVVLMDVMMPDMDGFETIRRIRDIEQFEKLPIIALTAKAMKGDREKCMEAGASDYIAKPVDVEQLKSLLRVWLYE